MAFSCVTRNMFPILPLLVFLSLTPFSSSFSPSDPVTKDLLHQLCAKPPISNNICITWLESDPTTYTIDLKGLVDLVLEKTQLFAYKNLAMMKGLARLATDPTLKTRYGSCVGDYERTIKEIEDAQGLVSTKSYLLASRTVINAFADVSSCEAWLQGLANLPAYVPRRNTLIKRMCSIDNVFAGVLAS